MFSWDIQKAILNFDKHGVSFEEAATIFDDENGLDWPDPEHSTAEARRRLAESDNGRVLLVVYTTRKLADGKETTRIISARRASYREREAYFGS